MRKLISLTIATLFAASASIAAPTTPTPASTKKETSTTAKVESVTRQVEVYKSGGNGWKTAKKQASLATDDKIRTGKRSVARVQLADGSKIMLLQNSQAEMEKLSSVQKSIKLLRGRIRAIVAKVKGGNNFQIKTPVGVASVRGTDFEVSIEGPDDKPEMTVAVREGEVGVGRLGALAEEIHIVRPGEQIRFGLEGEIKDPIRSGSVPVERDDVRTELYNANVKNQVMAMAAEEQRLADYQTGKSLIDVDGARVRVDSYIMRPASNQFKLVVLNERPDRFDYFTYKGTFNTILPTDLSVALSQVGGKLGATSPDYYLTAYETLMSNTIDNITDTASGGHLVKITFDGTNYTLTDDTDPTNTRTVAAAALQSDGSYEIYNPVRDAFYNVSAANKDEAVKISVLDTVAGAYKNLEAGDIYWKSRYDSYSSFINSTAKTAYAKKSSVGHTLAIDLDADFTNSPITFISEYPSGTDLLHNRLSLYYSDGSKTTYDNYIIDDEGNVAPASAFDGLATSAAYKTELEKWNYQQNVTATEMGNRSIKLVVDPKIGTVSGLIQQ